MMEKRSPNLGLLDGYGWRTRHGSVSFIIVFKFFYCQFNDAFDVLHRKPFAKLWMSLENSRIRDVASVENFRLDVFSF